LLAIAVSAELGKDLAAERHFDLLVKMLIEEMETCHAQLAEGLILEVVAIQVVKHFVYQAREKQKVSPLLHKARHEPIATLASNLGQSLLIYVICYRSLHVRVKTFTIVLAVALVHDYFVDLDEFCGGADLAGLSTQEGDGLVDVVSLYESFCLVVCKYLT
jgi:hypothetical protein